MTDEEINMEDCVVVIAVGDVGCHDIARAGETTPTRALALAIHKLIKEGARDGII